MPTDLAPMTLSVRCRGDADVVLHRIREVLRSVVSQDPAAWPSAEAWHNLLPAWFVAASARERTPEEAERDLALWRAREAAGLPEEEEDPPWSVQEFVYWFTPQMRNWWWWDAEVTATDGFTITLATDEVHPPHDALLWLLRAAGVQQIAE
jgi:hypothetical protein